MSRSGKTSLAFGPGEQTFRLAFGELVELQESTKRGPHRVLRDFSTGDWQVTDVSEVLRIGLIGGGMDPTKALALVTRYCRDIPDWLNNQQRAYIILANALQSDEPAGKSEAVETPLDPTSQESNGDLPKSTKAQPRRE